MQRERKKKPKQTPKKTQPQQKQTNKTLTKRPKLTAFHAVLLHKPLIHSCIESVSVPLCLLPCKHYCVCLPPESLQSGLWKKHKHHAPVCHHAQMCISGRDACFTETQRWFHVLNCTQHQEGLFFLKKNFSPPHPLPFPPLKNPLFGE